MSREPDEKTAGYEFLASELVKRDAAIERLLMDNERLRLRVNSQELEIVRLQRDKDAIGRELARRVLEQTPMLQARAALEPKP